jgi:hypothetical protein
MPAPKSPEFRRRAVELGATTSPSTAPAKAGCTAVVDVFSRRVVGWFHRGPPAHRVGGRRAGDGRWRRRPTAPSSIPAVEGRIQAVVATLQPGAVAYRDREVLGWSSAAGCGPGDPVPVAVAGPRAAVLGWGACVLAVDRTGVSSEEAAVAGGRIGAGGFAVVPPRWRHATDQPGRADGPVPVVRKPRGVSACSRRYVIG